MRSNPLLALMVMATATSPSIGQVSFSYAPTTLDPGVPTEFTISVTDESGEGFVLGYVGFYFEVPNGLAISNLEWLGDLGDPEFYIFLTDLPSLVQTVNRIDAPATYIGPGETLDLAILTMTAGPVAAGRVLTLGVMPESAEDAFITDDRAVELEITAGRSVDLEITGAPSSNQVSLSYAPTTLDPGVPTEITISLTDESDRGFTISEIWFIFEVPNGLTITTLEWLDELGEPGDYYRYFHLPNWANARLQPGVSPVYMEPGATRDIATMTVTADPDAAGRVLTLTMMSESSSFAAIRNDDLVALEITAGRSVDLEITDAPSSNQVSLSYAPTTLDPGVPTEITISVTHESGGGFTLGHIGFVFEVPDGLAISDLVWLEELGDPADYAALIDLPYTAQTSYRTGGSPVHFGAGVTREIATLTVTADPTVADSIQTLALMPESAADALVEDADDNELRIISGRSVDLEIAEIPPVQTVSLSYAPRTLDPGVPTEIIIRVTDESYGDFTLGDIRFVFEVTDGLTINALQWLDALGDPASYDSMIDLPNSAWTSHRPGGSPVSVGAGATRAIAALTVTADTSAAGSMQTLTLMPESAADALIANGDNVEMEITAGRSVDLEIAATPSGDRVSFSYAPTTLDPGVPTDVTISVTDESDIGFAIVFVAFYFQAPQGLTISNFEWLEELGDPALYLFLTELPGLAQTFNYDGSGLVDIGPGATRDIAVLTMTASPHTGGGVLTLGVMPESENDAFILGRGYFELEITGGRSLELEITGTPPDETVDEEQDEDGDDNDEDDTPGASGGDEEEVVDSGSAPAESDRLEPDPDDQLANDTDQDEPVNRTADTVEDDTSEVSPTAGRPLFSFCGLGMIPFLPFTLTCLSVMKAHGRRRRHDGRTTVEADHGYLYAVLCVPGQQTGDALSSM